MNIRVAAFVTVLLAVCTGQAQAQIPDHLECYKIKDPLKLQAFVDLDSPQFGLAPNCKVGKAKFFCVPAEKTVISAQDKATKLPITPLPVTGPNAGDRICYKVKCPEPFPPDTQVTDQFGTRTVTKFKTQMLCTPAVKGGVPPRFVDNGDGTVTDNQTGLQWEKKVAGSGCLHCVNDTYTWTISGSPYPPDGTAFTSFLATLNGGVTGVGNCMSADGNMTTGGFAGHCDWRLPTIAELQTILLAPYPCGTSPCIDPTFGPIAAFNYWSSTTNAGIPNLAWDVVFDGGNVSGDDKDAYGYVRAVRAGS